MLIFIFLLIIIFVFYKKKKNIEYYKQYKYGIVLPCFNRSQFLEKTLNSLKQSNLNECIICIIDDHSTEQKTIDLIKNFKINNVDIVKIRNNKNLGIALSLLKGFNYIYDKCSFMINIDSDVIMKKNWIKKLYDIYKKHKNESIISGFNCQKSCYHKILKEYNEYYLKKSIGGINMFFNKQIYKKLFVNILQTKGKRWDWEIVNKTKILNIDILVTKPSVIQHIGNYGMNSSGEYFDYAEDY